MTKFIQKNWFKLIIIIILTVLIINNYQSQKNNFNLKQNTQKTELQLKINKEKRLEKERLEKINKEKEKEHNLADCLNKATKAYWSYIELNGTLIDKNERTYRALPHIWERASKNKKETENKCFKQYN